MPIPTPAHRDMRSVGTPPTIGARRAAVPSRLPCGPGESGQVPIISFHDLKKDHAIGK